MGEVKGTEGGQVSVWQYSNIDIDCNLLFAVDISGTSTWSEITKRLLILMFVLELGKKIH